MLKYLWLSGRDNRLEFIICQVLAIGIGPIIIKLIAWSLLYESGLLSLDQLYELNKLLQIFGLVYFATISCVRRLRDAKMNPWIALLYCVPPVGFFLFLALAFTREGFKSKRSTPHSETSQRSDNPEDGSSS